jgi:hypothetical protein
MKQHLKFSIPTAICLSADAQSQSQKHIAGGLREVLHQSSSSSSSAFLPLQTELVLAPHQGASPKTKKKRNKKTIQAKNNRPTFLFLFLF